MTPRAPSYLQIAVATALIAVCAVSAAQTAENIPDNETARDAERGRIESARTQAAAQHDEAAAACYRRFAVNACLERARVARRDAVAGLRQREHALNDADRRERAAAQTARIAERQAEAASERDAARTSESEAAARGRVDRGAEKAAAQARRTDASTADKAQASQRPVPPARDAADMGAERDRFEARQRAADERRLRAQDAAKARPNPSAPLPTPP